MFSHQYLIAGYFPPVWFAPGDEEHLTEPEKKPERKHVAGTYMPRIMERHKLHIKKDRQRDEDALFLLVS